MVVSAYDVSQNYFTVLLKALLGCKNLDNEEENGAENWNKTEISVFEAYANKQKQGVQNPLLEQIMKLDGDDDKFSDAELAALEAYLKVKTGKGNNSNVDDDTNTVSNIPKVKEGEIGSSEYLKKCGVRIDKDDIVEYDEQGRIAKIRNSKSNKVTMLRYDKGKMAIYDGYDKEELKDEDELNKYIKDNCLENGKLKKGLDVKTDEQGRVVEITDPESFGKSILIEYTVHNKIVIRKIRRNGVYDDKGSMSDSSPLVLDTNKDGKVSAKAGIGVDVNGDGKADGAAVGGDKMLAMTDGNGNGKIDGTEVFGNKTVSPFTGKPINAANGFDALSAIAKEAEIFTGIKCLNGSLVDVKNLKKALNLVGKDLGFISGKNVTELEDLDDVKYINVNNYTEHDETGRVQHRQRGYYVDDNNEEQKVHDVWFA